MATSAVISSVGKVIFYFLLFCCIVSCENAEPCVVPVSTSLTREEFKQTLNKKGLKITHQNVRGIQNNISELQEFISSHNEIDIFSASETHLQSDTHIEEISLDGYEFLGKCRTKGLGGGVGIYIKNNIVFKRRTDLEKLSLEIIWIEIFVKNSKSIIFGCCYRPPETSKYLINGYNDILHEAISNVNKDYDG